MNWGGLTTARWTLMDPEIRIQNCPVTVEASELKAFFHYLESTLDLQSFLEFSLTFLSKKEMHALNLEYRQQNSSTDILGFCLEGVEGQQSLGDIYLCPEDFRDDFGLDSSAHLLFFLVAHGILHCMGWTHDDEQSYQKMMEFQHELVGGFTQGRDQDSQGLGL